MKRRRALWMAAAVMPAALPARAQPAPAPYPDKPVRMIVPFAAGGASDVLGRLVGQKLAEALGQPVVIENRPGANGNIGSEVVAKSAPDGHTLLLAADGTVVINPSLYARLPYDVERDFTPITRVAQFPLILVAHPQTKAATLPELVALSRTRELDFASAGPGSTGHLAGELLKSRTGLRMTHVPYRGGGQAVTDVVAGQVPLLMTALSTAGPFLKDGRLKAMAVTSARRVGAAPEVPTVAEAGVPGFDVSSWYGLLGPAGMPTAVVQRLHAEVVKILRMPDVQARLQQLGAEALGDSPQEFQATIRSDLPRWAALVRSARINVE